MWFMCQLMDAKAVLGQLMDAKAVFGQLKDAKAVHIGPVGLENSKLKTARLDLRIYRTCE